MLDRLLAPWRGPRPSPPDGGAETFAPGPTPAVVPAGPASLDLADCYELTFELLQRPFEWRQRAVHELLLRDSDHVEATSAYQIRLPLEVVRKYRPEAKAGDRVALVLPFTSRPNQLLLDVDFKGVDSAPTALLLREESASFVAAHLASLHELPADLGELVLDLWEAIGRYLPDDWREHSVDRWLPRRLQWLARKVRVTAKSKRRYREKALARYLSGDIGFSVTRAEVSGWLTTLEPARRGLVAALGQGEDPESSADCILLAIPFMTYRPPEPRAIDQLVRAFVSIVGSMDVEAQRVLADYGRRWPVLVRSTVPLDRVASVKLVEKRPWVNAPSASMMQVIPFAEARSTHIEIRAGDHGVVLKRPRITEAFGKGGSYQIADALRETADTISVYSTSPSRPALAKVSVRVGTRLSYRLLILWLLGLIVLAGGVAVALPEASVSFVDSLALLTFPLTLAGAVVLSKETSPLAERLLRRWRYLLVAAIAALWLLTLARLLLAADIEWAEDLMARLSG